MAFQYLVSSVFIYESGAANLCCERDNYPTRDDLLHHDSLEASRDFLSLTLPKGIQNKTK